jgi:hypothetical protein
MLMWKNSYSECLPSLKNVFNLVMEEATTLDLFKLHNYTFSSVFNNLRALINPLDLNV